MQNTKEQLLKLVERPNDLTSLIRRGVEALETLAEQPMVEVEPPPPVCPHCGTENPRVQGSSNGDGKLSEFAMAGQCLNCHKAVYGIPQGWILLPTREMALEYLQERK